MGITVRTIYDGIPERMPVVLRDNATGLCFASAIDKDYLHRSDLGLQVWKTEIKGNKFYITVSQEERTWNLENTNFTQNAQN